MTILVTGGAGYIGSICVEALLEVGHEVVVLDNLSEGHRSAVDERAKFVLGDLSDQELIERVLRDYGVKGVAHLAGSTLVGESMINPGKYFRNNVSNGINLLEACVGVGIKKFVFSSTCATYGASKEPMTEETVQRPESVYGESKLMFEKMLRWYVEAYGIEAVTFRYFNAGGASERCGEEHRIETHLIPVVLRAVLGGTAVSVYGNDYGTRDGTCERDWVHVKDIGRGHVLGLEGVGGGTYNLGSGRGYTVMEVVKMCELVTGERVKVEIKGRRSGDVGKLIASREKALERLGWEAVESSLENIVRSAWEWHRKHPRGYNASEQV